MPISMKASCGKPGTLSAFAEIGEGCTCWNGTLLARDSIWLMALAAAWAAVPLRFPHRRQHRCRPGGGHAVKRQPVEFHRCRVWDGVAGQDCPFLEDQAIVVIDVRLVISFRMRHEKSDLAHHLLHGAVRVVEKGAFLVHGEFVDIFLAWRDGLLA